MLGVMICSYACFLLVGLHIGLHYGMIALVKRNFVSYMTLQMHFVFFDDEEPVLFYELDLLAITVLMVFTGYATAASSGLGESGDLLQEMAGTGEWRTGECFRGNRSEEDIVQWIESLGL